MATITIGHHPELTAKDVVSIFEKHFADKYQIVPTTRQRLTDLTVKRSAWTGVAVHLKQERDKTKLIFYGCAPSLWARALLLFSGILIGVLVLYLFVWKGITDEVRAFIETAEEFRQPPESSLS
jgi:hypothetical protein